MSKTQEEFTGSDIDGDPVTVGILRERVTLEVAESEGAADEKRAGHFYTPSQARELAAALMAAADYVEANQ